MPAVALQKISLPWSEYLLQVCRFGSLLPWFALLRSQQLPSEMLEFLELWQQMARCACFHVKLLKELVHVAR